MPKSSSNISNYAIYENDLQQFLKKNKAVDFYSDTSIGKPKGSYDVKPSENNKFMELYHKTRKLKMLVQESATFEPGSAWDH